MAELLRKWLADLNLSRPVSSFEEDFFNGYLLGDLLCQLGMMAVRDRQSLKDDATPAALVSNFALVASSLRAAGVPFAPRDGKHIMEKKVGAALRLVYALKMHTANTSRAAPPMSSIAPYTAASRSVAAGSSSGTRAVGGTTFPAVVAPASSTGTLALTSSGIASSTLSTGAPMLSHAGKRPKDRLDNKLMALAMERTANLSSKERHMALYLKKFSEGKAELAQRALADEQEADASLAAMRAEDRNERLQRLADNQRFKQEWKETGEQDWRRNQAKAKARVMEEEKFEVDTQQKAQQRKEKKRTDERSEVLGLIDEFESNLERVLTSTVASSSSTSMGATPSAGLGLNGAPMGATRGRGFDQSTLAPTSISGGAPKTPLDSMSDLNRRLANTTNGNAAAGGLLNPTEEGLLAQKHMEKIKERTTTNKIARKERERRRRKVLVDQTRAAGEAEEKKRQDMLLEKLVRDSVEERRIGEELWRTRQYKDVIRQNRAYREQQYAEQRQKEMKEALDRDRLHFESTKQAHEIAMKQNLERLEIIAAERQAARHQQNTQYCNMLVHRIVDVATKVANYRDLSDQALVPPAMWREWMALFVQDLPLLPAASSTETKEDKSSDDTTAATGSAAATGGNARDLAIAGGRDIETQVDDAVDTIRDSSDEAAARLDARTMEEYLEGEGEWAYSGALDVTATLVFDSELPPYERKELNRGKKADPKSKRAAAAKQPAGGATAAAAAAAKKPTTGEIKVPATATSPSGEAKHMRQSSTSSTLAPGTSRRDVRTPDRSSSSANDTRPPTSDDRGATPGTADGTVHGERKIDNHIFGSLVERVFEVASGKEDPEEPPDVPRLPIGICLLGKPFSGKATQATLLSRFHKLKILSVDAILAEALASIEDTTATTTGGRAGRSGAAGAATAPKSPNGGKRAAKTQQQVLAAKLKKQLGKGETVSDDVYVGLVVDAIRRIKGLVKTATDTPAAATGGKGESKDGKESKGAADDTPAEDANAAGNEDGTAPSVAAVPDCGGWVLVGFPETDAQAKLLEKELSGFEIPGKRKLGAPKVTTNRTAKVSSRIARAPSPTPTTGPFPSAIDLVIRLDVANEPLLRRAAGRRIDPETGHEYHIDYHQPDDDSLIKERLQRLPDADIVEAKLPEQFNLFTEQQPQVEEWFKQFANMFVVDGEQDMEHVWEQVGGLVRRVMDKQEADAKQREDEAVAAKLAAAGGAVPATGTGTAPKTSAGFVPLRPQPPPTSSGSGNNTVVAPSTSHGIVPPATASGTAPNTVAAVPPPVTAKPIDIQDLSHFTAFLDIDLARLLAERFSHMETNYTTRLHASFRRLRHERSFNLQHFAKIRKSFLRFLRRADNKMNVLEAFTIHYNDIKPAHRLDPHCKEELHQRVDELADQLWEITDQRKNESETELASIKSDGWIESRSTTLVNLYVTMMQLELDRYHGFIRMAHDYFTVLKGRVIPEEGGLTMVHLPLFAADDVKAAAKKAAAKRPAASKSAGKKEGKKGKDAKQVDDNDAIQILTDNRDFALDNQIDVEELITELNAPLEAVDGIGGAPTTSRPGTRAAGTTGNAAAKKVNRRPLGPVKKAAGGGATSAAGVTAPLPGERSLDNGALCDAQLREIVATENKILQQRLARLHRYGAHAITQLRTYATGVFHARLDRWLALRIRGESAAIDTVTAVCKNAIEEETPLYYQLRIEGEDVFIDKDLIAHPLPTLPTSSPFDDMMAAENYNRFTIPQLVHLSRLFRAYGSSGLLSTGDFEQMLLRLSSTISRADNPSATLPPSWANATRDDIRRIVRTLDPRGHGSVDWREFIVSLSLPAYVTTPSLTQLQAMKDAAVKADGDKDGRLTYTEYMTVPFWFEASHTQAAAAMSNGSAAIGGDDAATAVKALKTLYYQVFCTDLRRQSSMSSVTLSVASAGAPVSPVAAAMPTVRTPTDDASGAHAHSTLQWNDFLHYLCFNDTNDERSGAMKASSLGIGSVASSPTGKAVSQQWSSSRYVRKDLSPEFK